MRQLVGEGLEGMSAAELDPYFLGLYEIYIYTKLFLQADLNFGEKPRAGNATNSPRVSKALYI